MFFYYWKMDLGPDPQLALNHYGAYTGADQALCFSVKHNASKTDSLEVLMNRYSSTGILTYLQLISYLDHQIFMILCHPFTALWNIQINILDPLLYLLKRSDKFMDFSRIWSSIAIRDVFPWSGFSPARDTPFVLILITYKAFFRMKF